MPYLYACVGIELIAKNAPRVKYSTNSDIK